MHMRDERTCVVSENIAAVSYIRTSNANAATATNADDSRARQALAIDAYAERAGLRVEAMFIDASVKGKDAIGERSGFSALLQWCEESGCRTILVENASRFARDVIVAETGYAMLKKAGFRLIASDDPDAFEGDTPTSKMIRQILAVVSEFEKDNLVGKLRGAKERASASLGDQCAGRGRVYRTGKPAMIARAKELATQGATLRTIAGTLAIEGHRTASGRAFGPQQVARLVAA